MNEGTSGNRVTFLLDGKEFFEELARQLDAVAAAPPSDDTYVRMAFWNAKADCRLGNPLTAPSLKARLHAVADAGHPVQFIVWRPGKLSRAVIGLMDPKAGLATNYGKLRKDLDYRSEEEVAGSDGKKRRGRVQVYGEEYKGWVVGTTAHQKIAIFAVKGELTVIVGGFNLETPYYATTDHTWARPPRVDGGGDTVIEKVCLTWHDTAVKLTGPATVEVEQEWLRRWRKRSLRPGTLAQASASKQPSAQDGSKVAILTTNSEGLARRTDIRKALCERIASAEHYVYLENYALSDPVVVAALAARLRVHKQLVVLFVTGKGKDATSYLNRMALLKLSIAAGGKGVLEHVKDGAKLRKSFADYYDEGKVLEGDFSNPDNVNQLALLGNPFMARDAFQYRARGGQKTTRVTLGAITDATSDRVSFCYPVHPHLASGKPSLYVHSKLVVIDDDTAFVGSANLTYRSMAYDGEICARIAGGAAKAIRRALFEHYNLPAYADAAEVRAKLIAETRASTTGGKADAPSLRAFCLADFVSQAPRLGNHTWY